MSYIPHFTLKMMHLGLMEVHRRIPIHYNQLAKSFKSAILHVYTTRNIKKLTLSHSNVQKYVCCENSIKSFIYLLIYCVYSFTKDYTYNMLSF